jgi:flavin-dependent dehydrogenase
MGYEAIIAGGSFAGLAVAAQLHGRRILLVEPHAIGAVQTSACGTLLAALEATGTLDSLLQVHDRFVLHLGRRTIEYPLPYPFCTFDYRTFCQRLLAQSQVEVLRASVLGHQGHQVYTTQGTFEAEVLIDATGWRAALATNSHRQSQPHRGKSFGLETVIPVPDSGLHFFYDSQNLRPYHIGWLFPTGATSRAGFASYRGHTRLGAGLRSFVQQAYGQPMNGRHGGFFPYRRQPAITGTIFRVGDAAGQCLPFTGEGIRPALFFGAQVGHLVRRVLEGEMRQDQALQTYRKFVERHRMPHRLLLAVQKAIPGLPMRWIESLAGLIHPDRRIDAIMQFYWRMIDPSKIAWSSGAPKELFP